MQRNIRPTIVIKLSSEKQPLDLPLVDKMDGKEKGAALVEKALL